MSATSSPLSQTNDWMLYSQGRARQRSAGLFAAIVLVLAFAVLIDGLLSHMRGGGSYRLEMLAGTTEAVSGPIGSAPAVASDMRAFPIPKDAPLSFEFHGFFTSYWFGTGMWRGSVHVSETAPSGTYALAVGLEGQPSSSFQTYTISVARDESEQDRQSLSLVRRWTGWNPFILAGILAALGIGTGSGCFFLGRRCSALLADMGLAEIIKVQPEGDLFRVFAVTGKRAIEGKSFVVYDDDMQKLGKVIYDKEKNGISEGLFVNAGHGLPKAGSFIAFWEHVVPEAKPLRRGLFAPLLQKGFSAAQRSPRAEGTAGPESTSKTGPVYEADGQGEAGRQSAAQPAAEGQNGHNEREGR